MKPFIITAIFFFCIFCSQSQSANDSAAVRKAANDYIDGFYTGDTSKIYYSIDPGASKHGYYKAATDTGYRKIPMSFNQMIGYAKNERNRPTEANAHIRDIEILDLQSKIAAVKLRAWWGIDYLLLTKMQDKWVIEKVLWQSK